MLKKMETSHFHVAGDSQDIRGWKLQDTSGNVVGKVADLLFDPDAKEVRYAVVELDSGRRVNIPIGEITLDEIGHRATATAYTKDRLMGMRTFENVDTISGVAERDVYMEHHPGWKGETIDYATERFRGNVPQRIQLVEEQLKVGKRQVETGHVTLGKRSINEDVTEQIELGQERLEIHRKPMHKPVEGVTLGENETINVTLYGEEPVVGKQTFIKEEIEITKVKDTHTETVKDTIRHEELVTEGLEKKGEFASAMPTVEDLKRKRQLEKKDISVNPLDEDYGKPI